MHLRAASLTSSAQSGQVFNGPNESELLATTTFISAGDNSTIINPIIGDSNNDKIKAGRYPIVFLFPMSATNIENRIQRHTGSRRISIGTFGLVLF